MRALALCNPVAGGGWRQGRIARALERLHQFGWELELRSTAADGSHAQAMHAAWQSGVEVFIAAGGDGTFANIAGILAELPRGPHGGQEGESGLPRMALLPAGTANVLARHWRLPLDPEEAARRLERTRVQPIPIGRVRYPDGRQRYFLSMAGAGLDAHLVHAVEGSGWKRLGRLGYLLGFAGMAWRYAPAELQVVAGGRQYPAHQAIFGLTTTYAGGFQFGSRRDYGIPETLLIHGNPWRAGLRAALHGGFLRQAERRAMAPAAVEWLECSRIAIAGEPAELQADGEAAGRTPVEIELAPRALALLLPA